MTLFRTVANCRLLSLMSNWCRCLVLVLQFLWSSRLCAVSIVNRLLLVLISRRAGLRLSLSSAMWCMARPDLLVLILSALFRLSCSLLFGSAGSW